MLETIVLTGFYAVAAVGVLFVIMMFCIVCSHKD